MGRKSQVGFVDAIDMTTIQIGTNTRKSKVVRNPYPSDKSLWAYFMQGMEEPSDTAINEAFPGHHPLWVQDSQKLKVSGERFKYFRQHLLNITQQQCAAYLRIKLYTLRAWEQGREQVPFMAFELLRVVYEGANFKLSHPAWDGWFIERKTGRLVSPDRGNLSFTPHEFSYIRETHRHKTILEQDNQRLSEQIKAMQDEMEALRAIADSGALLDELHTMRSQLEAMLSSISSTTAKVYPFPQPDQPRKVATA